MKHSTSRASLAWRATALLSVLAIVAGACGSSSKKSSSSSATTAKSSNVGAGKDIVVGGIYSQTGPVPFNNAMGGADAFWQDINAKGGINGYHIKFVASDDASDAQKNAAAATKLVQTDKAVIISEVAEQTAPAGLPAITGAGIPLVPTYSQPAWYKTPGVYPIGAFYQAAIARAIVGQIKAKGFTKVAISTVTSPTAKIATDIIKQEIAKAGGITVVADITYAPTETDFTGQTSKVKSSGAEIALCICAQGHIVSWGKSAELQGYKGIMYATGYSPAYATGIGQWANGRLWTAAPVGPLGNDEARAAAEAVGKKYHADLDTTSVNYAYAWTEAEIIAEAIKRVGDKPMTSENLKIALATFKDWSGTYNAPLSYAPPTTVNADPNHCIQLQQVGTDGKLVTVDGKRFQCWEGTVAPA